VTQFPKAQPIIDEKLLASYHGAACEECLFNFKGNRAHHFVRRSHLRLDIPENLCVLCFDCHRRIHDGDQDLEKKLLKRRSKEDLAVLRGHAPHSGLWKLLED